MLDENEVILDHHLSTKYKNSAATMTSFVHRPAYIHVITYGK